MFYVDFLSTFVTTIFLTNEKQSLDLNILLLTQSLSCVFSSLFLISFLFNFVYYIFYYMLGLMGDYEATAQAVFYYSSVITFGDFAFVNSLFCTNI